MNRFSPLPPTLYEKRLAPPTGSVRMVLDTDTYNEVDDQFALAYALRSPERMTVEAVYAVPFDIPATAPTPKAGMEASYREAQRVFSLVGQDPEGKVFLGSEHFLTDLEHPCDSPAARDLIARAMASGENDPLYVVCIGAITNVASALLLEPRIREKIVVVWMAGHHLNWPTAWEFNLHQDMVASRLIFDCGVPLVHIPVQPVASELCTTRYELEHYLRGKSRVGDFLCDIVASYNTDPALIQVVAQSQLGYIAGTSDYPEDIAGPGCYTVDRFARSKIIFDVAPVAYLINPAWVRTTLEKTPLLEENCTWAPRPHAHPMRECNHIRRDFVFGDLFYKLSRD